MASSEGAPSQDELTMRQQQRIEQEISAANPLIGELENLRELPAEYAADPVYLAKAQDLSQKYASMRRTRPDGNCFFRAFAFAYLETLVENKKEYDKFSELMQKSKDHLISLGFTQFTVEDFYDTFMEVLQKVGEDVEKANVTRARHELYRIFNEQGYSDYIVVYLRLITSGQLQTDHDFYHNFIEGDRTVAEFCHQEVEPMYKESDHIHIIALCTALNVGVRVRYMDRGEGGQVIAHDFPEGVSPTIHLLYRPGHYDILYL